MKSLRVLALSLAAFVAALPAQADVITLRGDSWCPYNCEPGTAEQGYIIEVAKAVFEKAGHQVDYQTMTWARALEQVKTGAFTAAVGAAKEDEPALVFGAEPMGNSSNVFAVRADDSFSYAGPASLDGKVLGVINGYAYVDVINDYIAKNKADAKKIQAAAGDDALKTNVAKLAAKRIDVMVEDENVLAHYLKIAGLQDKLKIVKGGLEGSDIYVAFSPANPKSQEYAALLDKGVADMRASGELAKILTKYGVHDWK